MLAALVETETVHCSFSSIWFSWILVVPGWTGENQTGNTWNNLKVYLFFGTDSRINPGGIPNSKGAWARLAFLNMVMFQIYVIFDEAKFTADTLLPACLWKRLWEFHEPRSALCSPFVLSDSHIFPQHAAHKLLTFSNQPSSVHGRRSRRFPSLHALDVILRLICGHSSYQKTDGFINLNLGRLHHFKCNVGSWVQDSRCFFVSLFCWICWDACFRPQRLSKHRCNFPEQNLGKIGPVNMQ